MVAAESGDRIACDGAGEHRRIDPRPADQHVIAAGSRQNVITGAAIEPVVQFLSRDLVVAGPADGVFDEGVKRDGDIRHQAADIAKRAVVEIDAGIAGETRNVERIDSTSVPDRDNRRLAVKSRGEVERDTVGGAVEAIDRIAGSRRLIGAIDRLDGCDIMQQWGCRIIVEAVIGARVGGFPIGHDGVLQGILKIFGLIAIAEHIAPSRVIISRVIEAQGMAEFMDQCQQAIAARIELKIARLVGIDEDVANRREKGECLSGVVEVDEQDIGGCFSGLDKINIDQIFPQADGHAGSGALIAVKLR